MSTSEISAGGGDVTTLLDELRKRLSSDCPNALTDDELRDLFTVVMKSYVARQMDEHRFAPIVSEEVAATEGVVAVTAILEALNVELFELGMWKSWGMV